LLFYHPLMKTIFALALAVLAAGCGSQNASNHAAGPYNEQADAKLDIEQALSQASVSNTPVLVVFGGNWCGDCRALDKAMKTGAVAPLIKRDFQIVKVNIGHFDKNQDIAQSYGVPLDRGVPTVAILSPQGEVLYATKGGELSSARKMGDTGIYDFFKKVSDSAIAKK
jgi:thioredoxin 1